MCSKLVVPLKQPEWFDKHVDVLNASAVCIVETFGQVRFEIGLNLLIRLLTLNTQHNHIINTLTLHPPNLESNTLSELEEKMLWSYMI